MKQEEFPSPECIGWLFISLGWSLKSERVSILLKDTKRKKIGDKQ